MDIKRILNGRRRYSRTGQRRLPALLLGMMLTGCDQAGGGSDNRNLTLSWQIPDQREDGTPLAAAEIAQYRVYFGKTENSYFDAIPALTVDSGGGTVSQVAITEIPAALQESQQYFIYMTTVDTDGRESIFSAPLQVTP